jgi:carbamoyl-phosphate synthase large subunit
MNILVTGIGAIIGYGILRSLRRMDHGVRLIGADIFSDAVGQAWVDHFVLAPFTSSNRYSDWLENTLVENKKR